jgi:tape measure domain-containing protein
MAKVTIKDFLIQLGFDATAVTNGLNKVEKDVKSFNKAFVGLAKGQQTNNNRLLKGINAVNAAKRKQLGLDKKLGTQSNTVIIGKMPTEGLPSKGAERGGLKGNLAGPDRKDMKRLKAQQKAARKDRLTLENQAGEEDTKRAKNSLDLIEKKSVAQGGLQRKVDALNSKYGETEAAIRRNARAQGLNKKQADAMVSSVNSIKSRYRALSKEIASAKSPRALKALNESMKTTAANTARLTREIDKQNRKLTTGQFAAKGMSDSLKNLSRSYVSVFAIGAAAVGAIRIGQGLIASKAALLGASGSAEQAAKDFSFLEENSARLGVSLSASAQGYARVGAAARSAGVGVEEARNTFLAAQEVSAAFNLTADDSNGIFRAFSQILSKGKLSTEELLQIAERVPITFSAAAEAMKLSPQDLFKKIETGEVQSVDFLPDFADRIREVVRETGQLDAALKTSRVAVGRFKTAFEKGVLAGFENGTEGGLSDFFNDLTSSIKRLEPVFKVVGKVAGVVFSVLGTTVRILIQTIRPLAMILESMFGKAADDTALLNSELRDTITLLEKIKNQYRFATGFAKLLPAIAENRLDAFSAASSVTTTSSKVVTNVDQRVFSPTVQIENGDPALIRQTLDDWSQEMFTVNYSAGG